MGGFIIGWLTGVVTLLVLSGLAVHLAALNGPAAGDSDIRLQINIQYLNDAVRSRLRQQPQVIVGNVKTTDLTLGLAPQAALVMTPTFDVAGFFQVSPTTDNQLSVRDGKLAMNMVGDPRLGDLPVPISLLPFDLAGQIHQAVDQITNDVLLAELNNDLRAGFGSDTFDVIEVQTDGDYLALKLRRK
jgi:hypothetical protein